MKTIKLLFVSMLFMLVSCEKDDIIKDGVGKNDKSYKKEWIVDFKVSWIEYGYNILDYDIPEKERTSYLNIINLESVEYENYDPKYKFKYQVRDERFCEHTGEHYNIMDHPFYGKIVTIEFIFDENKYTVPAEQIMHYHFVKKIPFCIYDFSDHSGYDIIVHSNDGIPHFDKYRKK